MKPIPQAGIVGPVAMREAELDYRTIIDMVRAALGNKLNTVPGKELWIDVDAIYSDRVVIAMDGRHFAYTYTINAQNQVELGDGQEVVETFVAVRESAPAGFMEAVDESGTVWEVTIIRSGLSLNNAFYPDAVLRESAPLFDGARVFTKSDLEHIKGAGKDVRNIVGWISEPRFVEGVGPDSGRLVGKLNLSAAEDKLRTLLVDAFQRGKKDLAGLSIDADGTARTAMREGKRVREAKTITKVNSVDLIVEPGAGGGFVRMIEAINPEQEKDMSLRKMMLEEIKANNPGAHAKLGDDASDQEITAAYREALDVAAADPDKGRGEQHDELAKQVRMIEARSAIGGCNLPQAAKDKLLADFSNRERFVEADVATAIQSERDYLAKFTESGHVSLNFDTALHVEDRSIKVGEMLDAFFDPAHKDHRSVQSFKECYIEVTGDRKVSGRIDQCDMARLRESVGAAFRESLDSTSFASVLGNTINRRLVADYRTVTPYDVWRQLVTVSPVGDFRSQERVRYGGYGDLPAVAQSGPYAALTSPTDEKASYAVTKRGGTEDITLEMIKNDDVGVIRQIPVKLSRAAKRTLGKFVLDFLRTNPAIYDTKALFHADHGNLGAAALDATSYAACRLAMLKQAEKDSGDRLGIGPKYIWVPADLEEGAGNVFKRATNLDETFIQSLKPTIIPVWYWTDANDWCASADPLDIPTIEIGFLDGNEEPELFVQDNPSVGSMFTNDKVTYKIRHIYGGNVMDYRGLYKGVVA